MTTTKQQWQRIPRSNCVSTQLSLLQSFTYYHQSVLIQKAVYNCGHNLNLMDTLHIARLQLNYMSPQIMPIKFHMSLHNLDYDRTEFHAPV